MLGAIGTARARETRHGQNELGLALGKKNWLYVGHDESGARTAAILTIIATCISHDLNPRAYLHLVTKLILGGWPNRKLRGLLPDRIAVSHPEVLAKHKDAAVPTAAPIAPPLG